MKFLKSLFSGVSLMTLLTGPAVTVASSGLWVFYKAVMGKSRIARSLIALYVLWSLYDYGRQRLGGRSINWLRYGRLWRWSRGYFPARLIKETNAPYDPKKKYIIACHPHGIIPYGAFLNVINNPGAFPGLATRTLTVAANFMLPLWREVLMGIGFVDASPDSARAVLSSGKSLIIVVGGAAEALYARPHVYDLVLASRLGFVRIAMQEGADLVPVLTFGENNSYRPLLNNKPGSRVRAVQDWLLSRLGFAPVLVHGRPLGLGLLPYATPLTTVIGTPISVPQCDSPTDAEVSAQLARYTAALEALHDKYRGVEGEADPLRIVDHVAEAELKGIRRGITRTGAGSAEPALNYGLRQGRRAQRQFWAADDEDADALLPETMRGYTYRGGGGGKEAEVETGVLEAGGGAALRDGGAGGAMEKREAAIDTAMDTSLSVFDSTGNGSISTSTGNSSSIEPADDLRSGQHAVMVAGDDVGEGDGGGAVKARL
jgi:hypothetical protein